jgi:putative acetyltransferase
MESPQFVIREMNDDDVDITKSILDAILSEFSECGSVLASAKRRVRSLEKVYRGPGSRYLLATHGDQIVGGVGIGPLAGLPHTEKIGEVRELFVHQQHRGLGFGRDLLIAGLEHGRALGYINIYLETTPEMLHAQKLFKRFGFKPVRETPQSTLGVAQAVDALPAYYLLQLASDEQQPSLDEQDVFIR